MDSLKSVYNPADYTGFRLPKCTITSYPSNLQYNVPRRNAAFINGINRNQLFLNVANLPSKQDQELNEIPQCSNTLEVDNCYLQILKNLDSMNSNLQKKMDDLQSLGVEKFKDEKLKEILEKNEKTVLPVPEASETVATGVVSTNEVKTKPSRKRTNSILSISEHHSKNKRKKRV